MATIRSVYINWTVSRHRTKALTFIYPCTIKTIFALKKINIKKPNKHKYALYYSVFYQRQSHTRQKPIIGEGDSSVYPSVASLQVSAGKCESASKSRDGWIKLRLGLRGRGGWRRAGRRRRRGAPRGAQQVDQLHPRVAAALHRPQGRNALLLQG